MLFFFRKDKGNKGGQWQPGSFHRQVKMKVIKRVLKSGRDRLSGPSDKARCGPAAPSPDTDALEVVSD